MSAVVALGIQCDGPGNASGALITVGCLESVGGGGYGEIHNRGAGAFL